MIICCMNVVLNRNKSIFDVLTLRLVATTTDSVAPMKLLVAFTKLFYRIPFVDATNDFSLSVSYICIHRTKKLL